MSYILKVTFNDFKYSAEKSIKIPATAPRIEQKLLDCPTQARSILESQLQLPVAGDRPWTQGTRGPLCRVCPGRTRARGGEKKGRRGREGRQSKERERREDEEGKDREAGETRGGGGGREARSGSRGAGDGRAASHGRAHLRGSEAVCPLVRAVSAEDAPGEPAGGRALPAEPQPWPRPLGAALLLLLSAPQSSLPATLPTVTPEVACGEAGFCLSRQLSRCNPGWSGARCLDQASLELTEPFRLLPPNS